MNPNPIVLIFLFLILNTFHSESLIDEGLIHIIDTEPKTKRHSKIVPLLNHNHTPSPNFKNYIDIKDKNEVPVCNMDVLRQYFEKKEEKEFNKEALSDRRIKMCPKMHKSCCSFSEIIFLLTQVKTGKKKLDLIFAYHEFFYVNLKINSPKKMKKIVMRWKNPNSKKQMTPEIYDKIDDDIDYLSSRMDQFNLSLNVVSNFYLRFYGGLVCEICTAADNHAIRIVKDEVIEAYTLKVDYSLSFFTELINAYIFYLYYMKFLSKLMSLVQLYVTYLGDEFAITEVKTAKEYHAELDKYLFCKKQLTGDDPDEVKSAIKNCKDAFTLIPSLKTGSGLKVVVDSLQYAYDNFASIFPKIYGKLKETKELSIPIFNEVTNQKFKKKIVSFNEYEPNVIFEANEMDSLEKRPFRIRENTKLEEYNLSKYSISLNPIGRGISDDYIFGFSEVLKFGIMWFWLLVFREI